MKTKGMRSCNLLLYEFLLGFCALTLCLAACQKEDTNEEQEGVNQEVLTEEQHKERLQKIGQEFLEAIPASDFKEVADLADYVVRQYCMGDEKTEPLVQYARECFQDISETYGNEENEYWYYSIDPFKNARKLQTVGDAYAHIRWNGHAWEVVEKDTKDIRFECPAQDGKKLLLVITPDAAKNGSTSVELSSTVLLTLDGRHLFNAKINVILNSQTGSEFNLSRDALQISYTARIAGYEFRDNRIFARANSKQGAKVDINIFKSNKMLLSFNVSGRVDVKEYTGSLEEAVETGDSFLSYDISAVEVNILGQLQVRGTCQNFNECMRAIRQARNLDESFEKRSEAVQQANDLSEAMFYYDGKYVPQGEVVWELIAHAGETAQDAMSFDVQPVFVFADGSRYSLTNDSFFNEENFGYLINLFKNLVQDYEALATLSE